MTKTRWTFRYRFESDGKSAFDPGSRRHDLGDLVVWVGDEYYPVFLQYQDDGSAVYTALAYFTAEDAEPHTLGFVDDGRFTPIGDVHLGYDV